jgi:acetyl esterase
VYPAVDLTISHPSIDENAEGYLLTKAGMEWFVGHYLGGTGIDAGDASVSPIAAPSARMRNAATASVLVAGFDPLRDEGLAYATALSDAGVATQTKAFSGQIHGFFSYRMLIPEAEEAIDWVAQRLKDAFAQR